MLHNLVTKIIGRYMRRKGFTTIAYKDGSVMYLKKGSNLLLTIMGGGGSGGSGK